MAGEANRRLVEAFYERLWNRGELDAADELLAADFAFRGSLGYQARGPDGFRTYVGMVRAAFPDFHNALEETIAEGDRIAARLTWTGTHRGPFLGIAPTGRRISYQGVGLFTVAGGRLASAWVVGDGYALLRQLGALG